MKKIVMCLVVMMAVGAGTVGCSGEKKEEVKPGSMVETGVNKVQEAAPAMVDKAQPPAAVVTQQAPMAVEGAKEQVVAPVAEPVAGAVGQAVETGSGVVQEGASAVQGAGGAIKQETDQAVEALPQGAGGVVDEEAARKAAGMPVK